jgi:Ca2+-binding RTX toxin-like protein
MSDIIVSNSAEFVAALKKAGAGDVIKLKPGTYDSIILFDYAKTNVTITSYDAKKPAVLTELKMNGVSGLTFTNLEMQVSKDLPFQVLNSKDVHFDSVYVHGTLNGSSNDDYRGMIVRDSSNVSISNSRFTELTDALTHLNNDNVLFEGNNFNLIRDNGIAGGGSSHLTIKNNYFTNFDHVGDIHPDAIQLWNSMAKSAATDIVIDGNVFERGNGAAIQGIFMRDEVGGMPFTNVSITNNTVVGALYQGISVSNVNNLTVSGNTVVASDDQASWIQVKNSTNATVSDNFASAYQLDDGIGQLNNVLIGSAKTSLLSGVLEQVASLRDTAFGIGKTSAASLSIYGYFGESIAAAKSAPVLAVTEQLVSGTSGDDRLAVGAVGNYRLEGGAGNDSLTGGGTGVHKLIGGLGNDTYYVNSVHDQVIEYANEGTDTVVTKISYALTDHVENLRAVASDLILTGNDLDNSIIASGGNNTLYGGAGNDVLQGAAGNDHLYGGIGNDRLYGNDGNDFLYGEDGNDQLYGGNGNDTLYGGAGNDILEGGSGADVLYGGAGADTFVFRQTDFDLGVNASIDKIMDFSRAEGDKINLSLLDANTNVAGDQAFKFIGTEGFHNVAGELRVEYTSEGAVAMGDWNGDGVADFKILIANMTSMVSTDFYL